MSKRPFFILIVLDGFGCRKERDWNAIAQATTPRFDTLFADSPWTTVEASGLRVGLPAGQMGNSEVGHLNMGAGRVVDQDIVRISKAVELGDLAGNQQLVGALDRIKRDEKAIHFVGLLSRGGVHSLQNHLYGLIDAAIANGVGMRSEGLPSIFVHAILDGRDTPPMSSIDSLRELLDLIRDKPQVRLSTIIGRYYTMDRDRRWERTRRGYDLMTLGAGTETHDPIGLVERFWQEGTTDEFMEPIAVVDSSGAHRGKIRDGDTVVFFNFRADRMRQIVTSFRDPRCDGFERILQPRADLMSMVRYHEDFDLPVIFPPAAVRNHLGEIFSAHGMRQLRIAETEKYAHVTYFFNGGSDEELPGEERILIPSPKVATYDLEPRMSVVELAAKVVDEIDQRHHDVMILNIANPDMVGHTGVMTAAVLAVEATDRAVDSILNAVERVEGIAMITADHGNCELMFDVETGQPHTAHTSNPVPLIIFDPLHRVVRLRSGGALENVAPTILEILGLSQPPEMTASSLIEKR